MDKIKGRVKWFNDSKGYGVVTDGTSDYFIHYTQVVTQGFQTLTEDQEVTFEGRPTGSLTYPLEAVNLVKENESNLFDEVR